MMHYVYIHTVMNGPLNHSLTRHKQILFPQHRDVDVMFLLLARSKQHKDEKLLYGHGDVSARLLCACQFVIDVGTFEWIYYEEMFGEH